MLQAYSHCGQLPGSAADGRAPAVERQLQAESGSSGDLLI